MILPRYPCTLPRATPLIVSFFHESFSYSKKSFGVCFFFKLISKAHFALLQIRAANFMHCSFSASFYQGLLPAFRLADTHRECVRAKALGSILGVRNVSREEAEAALDRVFDRCYADLEPAGIRPKKRTYQEDCRRAFQDAKYYGYVDFDEKSN